MGGLLISSQGWPGGLAVLVHSSVGCGTHHPLRCRAPTSLRNHGSFFHYNPREGPETLASTTAAFVSVNQGGAVLGSRPGPSQIGNTPLY